MSTEEICAYPPPQLDEDCLLFLWRLSSMQRDALEVCAAWGFRDHSELVWNKLTSKGNEHFGMGRIVRGAHETCLIGVRGRASRIVECRSLRSTFKAPVPRDANGKIIHSAKPPEFYGIVRRLSSGPYHESFARERREGWTQDGLQLPRAGKHERLSL